MRFVLMFSDLRTFVERAEASLASAFPGHGQSKSQLLAMFRDAASLTHNRNIKLLFFVVVG